MTNVAPHFDSSPEPTGYVGVDAAGITAEVTFCDPEVAEILRQVPDGRRVEFFVRATRAGALAMGNDITTRLREAMRFMQTTLDTQVTSFGERMAEKVREQLGDADKDGHVERRLQEILTTTSVELRAGLEKALPQVFDNETKKSVEVIQAEGERAMRQIAALFSEEGIAWHVIQEARRDFAQRLEEVKAAMTVAQTKAANPTPRDAGLDYEAAIHGHLATIGSLRGDDVENTANKVGKVPNCKKGDTRILVSADGVDVTAQPCIAVEIRDRAENEFTLDDVATMLRNREAQFGMVIAAHAGSLPKQFAGQPLHVSRTKRLITLVLEPASADADALLAAVYQFACVLTIESVRQSRDGNWDEVARKVEAIEQALAGIAEARTALGQIERKAHDAGSAADKRNAYLVRLIAELGAIIRTQ
jgi:hypothetical protein